MFKKIIGHIENFFFPQRCLICKKENELLCRPCLKKIDFPDIPQEKNIFAATNYQDHAIKRAIWLLKYRGVKQMAEPLAELVKQRVSGKIRLKDPLIIPVPVSRRRLRQRGYNQAEIIAKHFQSSRGCLDGVVAANILYKKIHTESQVSARDREKRLGNVIGSFEVKNAERIKGRNVILLDDVYTTGATMREAMRALRQAGAKKIIGIVVARG